MKNVLVAFSLVLAASGCATSTVGPDGCEETFAQSVARGLAEGLVDAMFEAVFGERGTTKVSHRQDRWLSSKVQTSVSSPR